MRLIAMAALITFALTGSRAQEVPPPPKPSDGPSLEVTMKYIEDKVSEENKQKYTTFVSDGAQGGAEWNNQFAVEISNFVADPKACRISFHWRSELNGKVADDSDYSLILKDVHDIVVLPQEANQQQVDARNGHPSWTSRIQPTLFTLVARRPKGLENAFLFSSEELAGRVAKAMVHAVELCGGGDKDPFK
jgi:hypothetical protein